MAGVLTTTEIMADMRANLGSPDTTVWSDAMLLRDINRAYVSDICAIYDLPELDYKLTVTTTAGSTAVSLSGGSPYLAVRQVVRASDSVVLERISAFDFGNLAGYISTTTGVAEKWRESGEESLQIWPIPVTGETLYAELKLQPTALTDGDATIIACQWDEVLNAYAHARFAMRLRLYDDANAWRQLGDTIAAKVGGLAVRGSEMFRTLSSQNTGYQARKD